MFEKGRLNLKLNNIELYKNYDEFMPQLCDTNGVNSMVLELEDVWHNIGADKKDKKQMASSIIDKHASQTTTMRHRDADFTQNFSFAMN
jgi:hypothetical protein